jgi:pyruvate,water dikinase
VPPLILPFTSSDSTLALAGGKGQNLAELVRAGFPVPPGFIVATEAYQAFIEANHLKVPILFIAKRIAPDDPAALEAASADIATLFALGQMPAEIAHAVASAYHALSVGAGRSPLLVAARSSATAEDLPGLSFAGQQERVDGNVGRVTMLEG